MKDRCRTARTAAGVTQEHLAAAAEMFLGLAALPLLDMGAGLLLCRTASKRSFHAHTRSKRSGSVAI